MIFTPEHEAIRNTIAQFIDKEINPFADQWEEGFSKYKQFKEREGHWKVPKIQKEEGYQLGIWVISQRLKKDKLSSNQIDRLDASGFVWDPYNEDWEEGFRKLQQFYEREGNCRVPAKHEEYGYNLGNWVHNKRRRKDILNPNQIKKLDALGFVWASKITTAAST